MGKDKKLNAALQKTRVLTEEIQLRLKEQEQIFNTEDRGFLDVEHERERTLKVTQKDLKALLPIQSAANIFSLELKDYGPYGAIDISRNGRFILLGGKKGHISEFNWK